MFRRARTSSKTPQPRRTPRAAIMPAPIGAFTLIEVLVGVAIIAVLLSISGLALNHLVDGSVMAQAKNALLVHARVARSYAVTHRIETMLVVNPLNGRFEIWYLNPPTQGGNWDPLSSGGPAEPWKTDGCMFAPVLNSSARLPVEGDGRPAVLVSPIDYSERPRDASPTGAILDNLTWAAVCFNETGDLVIRTRRIPTKMNSDRLDDGSPNLSQVPLVDGTDSPITSARGFVISDASKLHDVLGEYGVTSNDLVNGWLMATRPTGRYAQAAVTIVLNRFSGDEIAGGF